jgi:hypothetical protein
MAGVKPACMDQREWLVWCDANESLRPDEATTPCRDCTPLWHADMVAGGMCDGVPRVGRSKPALGLRQELNRARMREYRRRKAAGMPT